MWWIDSWSSQAQTLQFTYSTNDLKKNLHDSVGIVLFTEGPESMWSSHGRGLRVDVRNSRDAQIQLWDMLFKTKLDKPLMCF